MEGVLRIGNLKTLLLCLRTSAKLKRDYRLSNPNKCNSWPCNKSYRRY